jgi:hypothetical protein
MHIELEFKPKCKHGDLNSLLQLSLISKTDSSSKSKMPKMMLKDNLLIYFFNSNSVWNWNSKASNPIMMLKFF